MTESDKTKLQSILRKIDALKKEVEELIGGDNEKSTKKPEVSIEAKALIESIGALSTSDLETRLNTLGHKDLGDVFVAVGGSSGDKRKPKAWLIERIMWLAKEFSESHKSIRES
ncbi:hypothetical protein [Methylosarcina fibrata]|uniref:hypothetical protein n=1 Tax=Methylosarcina fibrata TaxID=105972 RepID=UPI00037AFD76|nr:hypothetical protein [Methylosarcina fibrata]